MKILRRNVGVYPLTQHNIKIPPPPQKKKITLRLKPEYILFVCFWRKSSQWARASSFTRFLDHTQRHTTVGRIPLDERSARRRDLHLATQNTLNRQTSIPPVGFEPIILAGERPQTYALDRAATGTGKTRICRLFKYVTTC